MFNKQVNQSYSYFIDSCKNKNSVDLSNISLFNSYSKYIFQFTTSRFNMIHKNHVLVLLSKIYRISFLCIHFSAFCLLY